MCPRARSRDPDRAVWSKASQPTAAGSRAERSGGSRMAEAVGAVALIAAPARRRWLWSVLAAMLGLLTARISALEVHTPKEIFVVNGTQGKLTCTFDSPNTTGWLTTVSWSFQPDGTDSAVSFFHYSQGQVYIGDYPPFKDRVTWAGDLDKKDASINIENIQAVHNGTYICDVKNPPDIVVRPGHIRLHVVEIDNLLVFLVWVVVGTVTAVVLGLTLLISLVLVVLYRRKHSKRDYTGCSTSERLSPVKQAPRKCPSDTEGLVKSPPSAGSHQGPVIYAQLDHSGGHHSGKINKSESVVYADIRKD